MSELQVQMKMLYDSGGTGDARFILEEDEQGHLFETSNAVTRQIVCSALFTGWGIEQEPRQSEWLGELAEQFGGGGIARRYLEAALDMDK